MKKIFIGFFLFSLPAQGIAQATEALLIAREPINLIKAVGGADVLLVGDDHPQPEIKTFLIHQMEGLRVLGFRCLAIEMLPSHFQSALDRWNESDQNKIRGHLSRLWGEKGRGIPESLFELIATAKREGLMVVALDPDESPSMDRQQVNPHWVECVQRCRIGKNGSKMIVFGGSSHFQPQPLSALSLLKDQGVRCSVLEFSGLENPRSVALELKSVQLLGREVPLALQLTAENQRHGWHGTFMLPYSRETSVSRWIINMEPELQLVSLTPSK
jgi:hypothetical protein